MINKKVVVIGNGPSLKGFDFHKLSQVDSIGMNAAYRYWEKINWYPTHYTCLDDQLIETHADAINELIVSGKVKTAFLIAKILDYHPDLIKRKNVFYLESFHKVRQQRESHRNIPYISSTPFRESDSSKVTTGAYAVRYAAHLEYEEISIIGVDLRYVEIIPEANQTDGIKLVMNSTPKDNPNYFFDGYQQKGDKFNIPNPSAHDGNLHESAFDLLANDMIQFDWKSRIYNSNKESILWDKGIFPYLDIYKYISKRKLSAVVVPTTTSELSSVLKNIIAWDQPNLIPSVGKKHAYKPDLIFAFSSEENIETINRIKNAFAATQYLQKCFNKLDVIFLNFSSNIDYYEKNYDSNISGEGYKSGPNEQFFNLINYFSSSEEFIFYMETDCVPIRQGWLDRIIELAEGDQESWIIGSYYKGIDKISDDFFLHLNGNALYRTGDRDFIKFTNEFWQPSLHEMIKNKDARIAYDCLLSSVFSQSKSSEGNKYWNIFQQVGHRLRATEIIQNISGSADQTKNPLTTIQSIITTSPQTYIVHGGHFMATLHEKIALLNKDQNFSWRKFFSNTGDNNVLADSTHGIDPNLNTIRTEKTDDLQINTKPGINFLKVISDSHFTELSPNLWKYNHSNAPQKLWIAVFNTSFTKEREYNSSITLETDTEIFVSVSLGRNGNSEYEGDLRQMTIFPNKPQTITVNHKFKYSHSSIKIQIDILSIKEGIEAQLKINSYSIIEAKESSC